MCSVLKQIIHSHYRHNLVNQTATPCCSLFFSWRTFFSFSSSSSFLLPCLIRLFVISLTLSFLPYFRSNTVLSSSISPRLISLPLMLLLLAKCPLISCFFSFFTHLCFFSLSLTLFLFLFLFFSLVFLSLLPNHLTCTNTSTVLVNLTQLLPAFFRVSSSL